MVVTNFDDLRVHCLTRQSGQWTVDNTTSHSGELGDVVPQRRQASDEGEHDRVAEQDCKPRQEDNNPAELVTRDRDLVTTP
ncbi:MAG: hypothetical protein ABIP19_15320 [Dermatophilaceae bacterium]